MAQLHWFQRADRDYVAITDQSSNTSLFSPLVGFGSRCCLRLQSGSGAPQPGAGLLHSCNYSLLQGRPSLLRPHFTLGIPLDVNLQGSRAQVQLFWGPIHHIAFLIELGRTQTRHGGGRVHTARWCGFTYQTCLCVCGLVWVLARPYHTLANAGCFGYILG